MLMLIIICCRRVPHQQRGLSPGRALQRHPVQVLQSRDPVRIARDVRTALASLLELLLLLLGILSRVADLHRRDLLLLLDVRRQSVAPDLVAVRTRVVVRLLDGLRGGQEARMDVASVGRHASQVVEIVVGVVRRGLAVSANQALDFAHIDVAWAVVLGAAALRVPNRGGLVMGDRVDDILFGALSVLLEVDEGVEGLVGEGGDEDRDQESEHGIAVEVVLCHIPGDVQSVPA